MACAKDRYAATYVVAPALGPPDCQIADFTDIQTAINALPPTGGKVFVKAGTYVISKTIQIKQSNVHIQGEGMGITNIVADATMTASPAIEAYNSLAGSPLPLVADTATGDTTVTLNPPDAATLAVGDYILLFSTKPVDAEAPTKHAGEVKQVVAVAAATGVITVDDQIYDAYLLADSAALAKITMLRGRQGRRM
jgi:polygalacturonase